MISRREFVAGSAVTAAALMGSKSLFAADSEPAIGLQLYSVRKMLEKDYAGTLRQVAEVGFRNVEAAGFYGQSAADVKQIMTEAGLNCFSAHYSLADLLKGVDATIDYAKALGLEYVICSSPSVADPSRFANAPGGAWQAMHKAMTADDWKWNAEQFNQIGQKMKANGLKFGYHNHTMEFRELEGGTNGYQILLKDTDPAVVTLEMDCGWVAAAGGNPAEILLAHPTRFTLLHIKDFKAAQAGQEPGQRVSTELGKGVVDLKPIFAAARKIGIRYEIVEQEEFDMPAIEALKIDFEFMRASQAGGTAS
jgi:sugar phosphate isomerase/epimerase